MKRRYIIGYSLLLLTACARVIENLSKSTLSRKSKNVEKLRLTVTDVSKVEQLKGKRGYGHTVPLLLI